MKRILGPEQRAVLEGCAAEDGLLAFDYDGTLAPIVGHPVDAHMRPETQRLLARLAEKRRVVIMTGRSRGDVARFLAGVRLFEVVGNHGVEAAQGASPDVPGRVQAWRRELEPVAATLEGAWVEDKTWSLALHYRGCADKAMAAARLQGAAALLEGARIVGGKDVVNVLPRDCPDKGLALWELRSRLGWPPALFVGDDQADEDIFRQLHGPAVVGVRVGFDPASRAQYCLDGQGEIDRLLEALLALTER